MKPHDMLLEADNDLKLTPGGDIDIGDATLQHQALLLQSQKGEWKQSPATGIGVEDFIADDLLIEMENEIRKQLIADGMTIQQLDVFEDGSINLTATYE